MRGGQSAANCCSYAGESDTGDLKSLADRWHTTPRVSLPLQCTACSGMDRPSAPLRPRRYFMEKRLLLVLLAFALFALGLFIHSHGSGLPDWLPR